MWDGPAAPRGLPGDLPSGWQAAVWLDWALRGGVGISERTRCLGGAFRKAASVAADGSLPAEGAVLFVFSLSICLVQSYHSKLLGVKNEQGCSLQKRVACTGSSVPPLESKGVGFNQVHCRLESCRQVLSDGDTESVAEQ